MSKSFPYDQWSDTVTDFWTWGGHNSGGTYVLTALGCMLALTSLIAWLWLDKRKLAREAARLRASGDFGPRATPTETSDSSA